jgi:3-oxoacid CoA-transferase subunit A
MHFYITGDTHGDFSRIAEFCETNGTDEEVKNNGTE